MAGAESSDEQRATQLAKRETGVSAIKRTPAYILTVLHRAARAKTPDPYEKMSKRSWEKSMMGWRASLRAALHQIHNELADPTPDASTVYGQ